MWRRLERKALETGAAECAKIGIFFNKKSSQFEDDETGEVQVNYQINELCGVVFIYSWLTFEVNPVYFIYDSLKKKKKNPKLWLFLL